MFMYVMDTFGTGVKLFNTRILTDTSTNQSEMNILCSHRINDFNVQDTKQCNTRWKAHFINTRSELVSTINIHILSDLIRCQFNLQFHYTIFPYCHMNTSYFQYKLVYDIFKEYGIKLFAYSEKTQR